jgi:hypothetical protein
MTHEVQTGLVGLLEVALLVAVPAGLCFLLGRRCPTARALERAETEAYEDGFQEGLREGDDYARAELAAAVPAVPAAGVAGPDADAPAGMAEGPPGVPAAAAGSGGELHRSGAAGWLSDMHEQLSPARLERPDDDEEPVTGQIVALAAPVVADLGRVGDGSDRTFYRCQLLQAQWRRAMDAEIHDLDALLGLGAAA